MESMWIPWNISIPYGVHVEPMEYFYSIWTQFYIPYGTKHIPHGFHVDSMEYLHSTWNPYGFHMECGGRVNYCLPQVGLCSCSRSVVSNWVVSVAWRARWLRYSPGGSSSRCGLHVLFSMGPCSVVVVLWTWSGALPSRCACARRLAAPLGVVPACGRRGNGVAIVVCGGTRRWEVGGVSTPLAFALDPRRCRATWVAYFVSDVGLAVFFWHGGAVVRAVGRVRRGEERVGCSRPWGLLGHRCGRLVFGGGFGCRSCSSWRGARWAARVHGSSWPSLWSSRVRGWFRLPFALVSAGRRCGRETGGGGLTGFCGRVRVCWPSTWQEQGWALAGFGLWGCRSWAVSVTGWATLRGVLTWGGPPPRCRVALLPSRFVFDAWGRAAVVIAEEWGRWERPASFVSSSSSDTVAGAWGCRYGLVHLLWVVNALLS